MRILATIVLTLPLTGCFSQSHITRTVHRADGSTETYENHSNGYNYNPNFTGHWDSHNEQNTNFTGLMPVPTPPQPVPTGFDAYVAPAGYAGQFTIR